MIQFKKRKKAKSIAMAFSGVILTAWGANAQTLQEAIKYTDNEQLLNGNPVVLYGKLNCNVNCDCKTLVIIMGLGLLFKESIACVDA